MKNTNQTKAQAHILTLIGGTNESPVYCESDTIGIVAPRQIAESGSTLLDIAHNILAGNVHPDFLNKGGLDVFPRSLKNDKSAFKFLLDCKADTIRAAWNNEQLTRKRYTQPTLQALAKAVKNEGKEGGEMKKSVAEQVADILKGKGKADAKLKAIAELDAIAKYLEVEAS